jgi:hypothetical protein
VSGPDNERRGTPVAREEISRTDIIGSTEHAEKGRSSITEKRILRAIEEQWRAACQMLSCACHSRINNWLIEGFDTADLKEAKALLEELSG